MSTTMQQVLEILEAEEPDYQRGAQLGREALPHLVELMNGPDIGLAAKATSLAPLLDPEGSIALLEQAARHPSRVVRVAAAAAAGKLPQAAASDVLLALLSDDDIGVRKVALRSAGDNAESELRDKVAELRARGEGARG